MLSMWLSDRCCLVIGSNKVAIRHKPQQEIMPAYFYCCRCWHETTPHNGVHNACTSSKMASPDAELYSHTNTVSTEAATTCVLVMVRHSGSTIVALESTGVPMASQRMTLHCPVSSPLVTRMQCCPAACMHWVFGLQLCSIKFWLMLCKAKLTSTSVQICLQTLSAMRCTCSGTLMGHVSPLAWLGLQNLLAVGAHCHAAACQRH